MSVNSCFRSAPSGEVFPGPLSFPFNAMVVTGFRREIDGFAAQIHNSHLSYLELFTQYEEILRNIRNNSKLTEEEKGPLVERIKQARYQLQDPGKQGEASCNVQVSPNETTISSFQRDFRSFQESIGREVCTYQRLVQKFEGIIKKINDHNQLTNEEKHSLIQSFHKQYDEIMETIRDEETANPFKYFSREIGRFGVCARDAKYGNERLLGMFKKIVRDLKENSRLSSEEKIRLENAIKEMLNPSWVTLNFADVVRKLEISAKDITLELTKKLNLLRMEIPLSEEFNTQCSSLEDFFNAVEKNIAEFPEGNGEKQKIKETLDFWRKSYNRFIKGLSSRRDL